MRRSMEPVFLVYNVNPAEDPNTMAAMPSCSAVGLLSLVLVGAVAAAFDGLPSVADMTVDSRRCVGVVGSRSLHPTSTTQTDTSIRAS